MYRPEFSTPSPSSAASASSLRALLSALAAASQARDALALVRTQCLRLRAQLASQSQLAAELGEGARPALAEALEPWMQGGRRALELLTQAQTRHEAQHQQALQALLLQWSGQADAVEGGFRTTLLEADGTAAEVIVAGVRYEGTFGPTSAAQARLLLAAPDHTGSRFRELQLQGPRVVLAAVEDEVLID